MAKRKERVIHHESLGNRLDNVEIVQFPLFPDEVELIQELKIDPKAVLEAVCDMVAAGMEVIITQNTHVGGYSVCIRAPWTAIPNAGKAYYSNAPTVELAIQTAVFKYFSVANGGAWRTQSLATRPTLS